MNPTYPASGDHIYLLRANGTQIDASSDGGTNLTNITGSVPTPIADIHTSPYAGYLYAATARGVYALDLPPATPREFTGTSFNNHPKLIWRKNTETDLLHYVVYKYTYGYCYCDAYGRLICGEQSAGTAIATTTDTTYTDNTETIVLPCDPTSQGPQVKKGYYVTAVDKADPVSLGSAPTASVEYVVAGGESPLKPELVNPLRPTTFALHVNYPNPFNPATTIEYALPIDTHVKLELHDVLGRDVAVLVNEHQTAGYKRVEFHSADLPSGVYFYRLTASGFVSVQKMIVAR